MAKKYFLALCTDKSAKFAEIAAFCLLDSLLALSLNRNQILILAFTNSDKLGLGAQGTEPT